MIDEKQVIPDGWELSTLGSVAALVKVKVDPAQCPDMPYVGLEHVEANTMRLLGHGMASDVKSTKTKFSAGDILYGKLRPYLNKVARPDFDGICSTDFLVFTESPNLDTGYLANYLNQMWVADRAHHLSNGVELPRVDWESLSQLPIVYPHSKDDQRAIVNRVNAVRQSQLSAGSHLTSARWSIERFRQAVLAAAGSGRLTIDWREDHDVVLPNLPSYDTRRPKQLRNIESYDLDELPEGWVWIQVENLLPPGGIFDGPFGSNLKTSDYTATGARVIRLENIGHLKFIGDKQTFVSNDKYHTLVKHAVYPGDIVFSSFVEEQVRVCILPKNLDTKTLAKADCFTIRPTQEIDRHYLALQLASQRTYRYLVGDVHGATRPRVNTTQVRSLPVPLCTLEEQREIVRRYKQLVSLADRLEQRLDKASQQIERSSQAVLAKAFRGELSTTASEEQNVELAV